MATIQAQLRNGTGKGVARQLRRQGRIPAVIYGGGQGNINLSLDLKSWQKLVEKEKGNLRSNRYALVIDDQPSQAVLVRGIERDPVTWTHLHVDFLRFDPNSDIDMEIPLVIVDEDKSVGIKRGGNLHVLYHRLAVQCKAGHIPHEITVSVALLDIGDSIHANDVLLPDGVTLHGDTNFAVVTISGVRGEAVADGGDAA